MLNQQLDRADGRWDALTPKALALGFVSLHCLPMRLRGRVVGVLSLFSSQHRNLDGEGLALARSLGDIATLAVIQHQAELDAKRLNDQLTRALNGRIAAEQAKGMVAQATSCGVEEAFALLRSYARRHHIALIELARLVVEGDIAPGGFVQHGEQGS